MLQAADTYFRKVRVSEELEMEGKVFHRYDNKQTITDNDTTVATDSGYTFLIQADAITLTLVDSVAGVTHKIMNDMEDGDCLVTIDSGNDQIIGLGVTGGAGLTMTNTKLTAKRGDYVILIGAGSDVWYIQECRGTWVIAA